MKTAYKWIDRLLKLGMLVGAVVALSVACSPAHAQYTETWGDDFNGPAGSPPNPNYWAFQIGNDFGNGELDWGTTTNAWLDGDGHLIIALENNPNETPQYTSGHLQTEGLEPVGPYGQVEADIKNPTGDGIGEAFWALGNNYNTVGWPTCGEIDMMESHGSQPNQSNGTIHGINYADYGISTPYVNDEPLPEAYHTYGMYWMPYHIQFYVDGNVYANLTIQNMAVNENWPFNQQIYLIDSAGVGGVVAGNPDPTTIWPQYMYTDYVHWNSYSSGVPGAPSSLSGTANSNSVTLNWTASSTSGVTYNVYMNTANSFTNGNLNELSEWNVSGTTYTAYALRPSTTYYFVVCSDNPGGESTFSNTFAITTQAPGNSGPVYINCGGFGIGNYMADTTFASSGNPASANISTINTAGLVNPAPQAVYTSYLWAPASYSINDLNANTLYNVRLHFCETEYGAVGDRVFNVFVNGNPVLTNFDIYATAGALDTALIYSYTAMSDANGNIQVDTELGPANDPLIDAIDITPDMGANNLPAIPTGVTATGISTNQISLSWNAVSGATAYNVFRSGTPNFTPGGGNFAEQVTTNSVTDNVLYSNSSYYYAVAAVNATGEGQASAEASATTLSSSLGVIGAVNCGGAASGVFAVDQDFSGGVTHTFTNTVNTTLLTGSIIPSEAVVQTDREGNFTYTFSNLTYGAPINITLYFMENYFTAAGGREFNVTINNNEVLTNFDIFATTGSTYKAVQEQFTQYVNTAGQIVIQFAPTVDNAECSGILLTQGTPPAIPANPAVTAADLASTGIMLTWPATDPSITSYAVYRGTAPGAEGATPIDANFTTFYGGNANYEDTGLTNGQTYYYKVTATNDAGTSGSTETSAIPNPWPVPGTVYAANYNEGGNGVAYFSTAGGNYGGWYRTNPGEDVGIEQCYDTTGAAVPYDVCYASAGQWIKYTVNVAQAGTYQVAFRMASYGGCTFHMDDQNGNDLTGEVVVPTTDGFETWATVYANVALNAGVQTLQYFEDGSPYNFHYMTFTYLSAPQTPATPTGLTATAGSGQIGLSWSASAGAGSYNVFRGSTSGGEGSTPLATGIGATTYTDTAVTLGATYYYTVQAANTFGTSGLSNEVSATSYSSVLAINCGGPATGSFVADTDFNGGGADSWSSTVATTGLTGALPPSTVLQSDREAPSFTYTIPGLTASAAYSVTLYFVENYYTSAGARVFSVTANGTTEVPNLDIYASADADYSAIQRSFNINANSSGQIVLQFTASVAQAKCSGIVINTASGGPYIPPTPSLAASGGNGQAVLSWTASAGSTAYNLYRSTTTGGEGSTPYHTGLTATTYTDTGLTNGVSYYYTVAAVNSAGTSAQSNQVSIVPSGAPQPSTITAVAGNDTVALSWSTTTGATAYNLYRATISGAEGTTPYVTATSATSYTDNNVVNGNTYYYTVAAIGSTGTSAQSSEIIATPVASTQYTAPEPPYDVTAASGNSQVILTWQDNGNATSYNIYRGTASGGESTTATATGITTTTYSDSAVTDGVTYYYVLTAVDAAGTSYLSNEATATPEPGPPSAPANLIATASAATVALTWSASTGATSYAVYRGTSSNGEAALNPTVSGTNFTDNTVANGTRYYYVVTATGVYGQSGFSNEVVATPSATAPSVPTGLTAIGSVNQVSLSWSGVSGATTYNIYRATVSGGEGATPLTVGVTSPSYADTATNDGITYYYTVAAVDGAGTSAQSGEAYAAATTSSTEVAINCGSSTAYGNFIADTDFSGGATSSVTTTITTTGVANPAPDSVYKSNHYGAVTYTIPNLTAGATYTTRLHFAEEYWTASNSRLFDITLDGIQVLTNFDIFAVAGGEYIANIQQFTTTANSSGQVVIVLKSVKDNAQVNGIEVIPVTAGPAVPNDLIAIGGTSQVSLSWSTSSGAATYNVYRATTSGGEGATPLVTSIAATAYVDTAISNGTTYYYTVAAVNSVGTSAQSNEAIATPNAVPVVPANVTATGANSTVLLSWTPSFGAASYNVYKATASGGEGSTPFATGITAAAYTDTAVTNGTTYYYTIAGVNTIGISAQSEEASATPAGGPAAPTGLTATGGPAQIALSWTAASGAASYCVYRGTASGAESATPIATGVTTAAYANTGLTAGTTYYYKVAAVNGGGTSAQSGEASAITIAGVPTGLSATGGVDQVALSWTSAIGAASYNVYSGTASGGESATPTATGITTQSYTNTGLTTGITYYYKVASVDAAGTSAQSTESSATANGQPPATPTGLTANAGNANVELTWTASSGATSYGIFRSTVTGGEGTTAYATSATTNFTDSGLTNGVTYYYTIDAVNAYGSSAQTGQVSGTPSPGLPSAPTLSTATSGSGQVSLTWTASTGATSYSVYRGTASGGESATPVATGVTTLSDTDTTVTNRTAYYYKVAAVNTAGTSAQSNELGATPISAPAGLTATGGTTLVALTWNADSGATGYNVYRGTASGGESATAIATGITTTAYTNSGLAAGTTYYYKVAAVDATGTSTPSTEAFAITIAGVPSGLTPAAGVNQVALSWTAGAGAATYNVYSGTSSGGEGVTPIATGLTTTGYTNTGLTAGTAYYYKVASVDAAGTSALSTEASATPTGTAPATPTGLTATASNAQVALSWTASAGATTYNIFRSTTTGGEGTTAYATSATTTYTNTGLTNGTTYYYTVNAANSYGSSAQSTQVSGTPSASALVIGINCGGSATGYWLADTDYSGGTATSVTSTVTTTAVTNPAPEAVYQSNRYGAFTYTIGGLTAGSAYTVRLHFAETYFTASGKRTFNVSVNGIQVLTNFDIYATSGAEDVANIQQFAAIANGSGQIIVNTASVVNNAQINGIEIDSTVIAPTAPAGLTATGGNAQVTLSWSASSGVTSYAVYAGTASGSESATPAASGITTTAYADTGLTNGTAYYFKVAAVNSGGTSVQSSEASATPATPPTIAIACGGTAAYSPYVADTDYSGGGDDNWSTTVNTTLLTAPIPPQGVLQEDREGTFTYTLTGLAANSGHSVTLYFVEQYFTASGKRVFSVTSNGTTVITNLDVYATAGAQYKAIQESFNTTATSSGQIVLKFTPSVNNAKCSGIAVY